MRVPPAHRLADLYCEPGGSLCPNLVSADPASMFQGFSQPEPITLTFSGVVGSVSVTGNGAISCDGGTYGTIVGYDSVGTELGRVNLHLIDAADCSPEELPDNVTYGATGTLTTSSSMATAVILPMTPLEFPVLDLTGHASATYTVDVNTGSLTAADSLKLTPSKTSGIVGDTITYTASARHGGAFIVNSWQWTADTASPPGYVEKKTIAACGTASTCKHTPGASGMIRVFGSVGGFASADSVHITMALPHIGVTCTPASVVRASATTVTCTAQSTNGALALTGWTFTGDSAIGAVPRTTSVTSTTWSGTTAVASGIVMVAGKVRGVPAISDTGKITVTPRSGWSWATAKSIGDATSGKFECNTQPHYATGNFGWATADSTCVNLGLLIWPDPSTVAKHGWTRSKVASGPNTGLWYVTSDKTGAHVRAQVLKDLRTGTGIATYAVAGTDTVGKSCLAKGKTTAQTVTTVNVTCMVHTGSYKYDSLYAFAWQHERCHEKLIMDRFATLPDARTFAETVVRKDTTALDDELLWGTNGYGNANSALAQASLVIDTPNANSWTFWSRNSGNTAWFLRTYQPNAILAPGC